MALKAIKNAITALLAANADSVYGIKNGKNISLDEVRCIYQGDLISIWQKQKYYYIAFNSNGGTGSMNQQTMPVGVATALTKSLFNKLGYLFSGWTDSADGEVLYSDGEVVTDITGADQTLDLYAFWDAITWYVRYNANGGSGSMNNSTHKYDTAKALTANAFTKSGSNFIGWATSSSGAVAYSDEQSVKNLKSTHGDVLNLYAVWKTPFYLNASNLSHGLVLEDHGTGEALVPTDGYPYWQVICTHGGEIYYSCVTHEIRGIAKNHCSKVKFTCYVAGDGATIEIGDITHNIVGGENIIDISSLTEQTLTMRLSTGYGATDHSVQISTPYFY